MDGDTLGNRIRTKRESLRITRLKLAGLVGLSERAISQIETGILNQSFVADYLPAIAAELGTTVDELLVGELHSERQTKEQLKLLQKEGIIRSDDELKLLNELATVAIKKRSNANIPLSREELLTLIEVMRGADGL